MRLNNFLLVRRAEFKRNSIQTVQFLIKQGAVHKAETLTILSFQN